MPKSQFRPVWLLLLLLVNALVGCQLVFGDVQIDDEVGGAIPVGSCKQGDYRCNAEYLLTCSSSDVGWMLSKTCNTSDLCDSKTKACQVCEPGQRRCSGAMRQECEPDGSKWRDLNPPCASPE